MNGAAVAVRPYRDADRDAVVALWRMVFPNDPPHNEPRAVIAARRVIDDDLFLVAVDGGGRITGTAMAGYDGHRGWLYAVAVDPQLRRRGIGRALVDDAVARLAARGCIKVNLQVREDNHAVADFYRRLGFDLEPRLSLGRLLAANVEENLP